MRRRHVRFKRILRIEDMSFGAGPTPRQPASDFDLPALDGRWFPTFSLSSHPSDEAKRRTGRPVAELAG